MNSQYIFSILISTPHSAHWTLYSVQEKGREEALFYWIKHALEPIDSELVTKLFSMTNSCKFWGVAGQFENFFYEIIIAKPYAKKFKVRVHSACSVQYVYPTQRLASSVMPCWPVIKPLLWDEAGENVELRGPAEAPGRLFSSVFSRQTIHHNSHPIEDGDNPTHIFTTAPHPL